jgi:membrane glycosyltransferase
MGFTWIETAIIALAMFTAFWIVLSVANAALGCLPCRPRVPASWRPLDIAVLLPVHGEDAGTVARHISAMRTDILRAGGAHRYSLHILSDSRDPDPAAREERCFAALPNTPDFPIHYRRRAQNHRFKAGNIGDWVARWGAAHDAMLVLDADSLMSGAAIRHLADTMAADPWMAPMRHRGFHARSIAPCWRCCGPQSPPFAA